MLKKLGVSLVLSSSFLSLQAYEFHPVGFESIAMGGAGVSNAKGSMAGYYNPALLAKPHYGVEVSMGFGLGVKEDNLAKQVDKLSDVDLTNTVDRVTEAKTALLGLSFGLYDETDKQNLHTAIEVLKSAYVQNHLTILPSSFFSIQYDNFHIGAYSTTTASAHMVIDPDALELYAPYGNGSYIHYDPYASDNPYSLINISDDEYERTSLQYALDNGKTYIELKGVSLLEVPLSYATYYDTTYGSISVGGSLKYMGAGIYADEISIDTDSDDIVDSFSDNAKTSSNFGIDIGFLYQPMEEINIGLVAKNLNSPEFDTLDPNDPLEVDPMVRGGITLSFWDSVDLSIDYDLTENETALHYEKSQYVGGGINVRPTSWFSFRAGMMNNVAYEDSPYIYTAGMGLGLKWLQLDLSAQVADDLTMVDGQEITNYAKVNFALVSRWGESYYKEVPNTDVVHDVQESEQVSPENQQIQREALQQKADDAFKELDKEVSNEN